ncbi:MULTISPECIES: EcsC family protein [unclassified Wenzhouxiangella]|uniref:EcsC family protein n=1 Tax=unclassified Wenzhouxiangella TaxID=2613841 RepID=UPI000E3264EF|nr:MULTISPECIES: EcsC family protein [unclassified Wenzhouxiangella]RFF26972.1 EcsC family protein [Wenzhouxiangella sp. 15181]RFP69484.1 EcsC family protein [Wenzhouxiangella sp. 15190]
MSTALSESEIERLRLACDLLENPSLAARISHMVGTPVEQGFELLPERWSEVVNAATRKAIESTLHIAVGTMDGSHRGTPSNWWHKAAATATGATGGAFGLAALAIELPISTAIMLRSIADIARSEGEALDDPEVRMQCLQVLALGGPSRKDDAAEIGYFAARAAMSRAVSEAASHIARKGLAEQSAPAIARLISQVASRFSIVVSEKAAAQAVPLIGAFGGAAINTIFIDHFQDMARGHFIVRRLERSHGTEKVRRMYAELSGDESEPELLP